MVSHALQGNKYISICIHKMQYNQHWTKPTLKTETWFSLYVIFRRYRYMHACICLFRTMFMSFDFVFIQLFNMFNKMQYQIDASLSAQSHAHILLSFHAIFVVCIKLIWHTTTSATERHYHLTLVCVCLSDVCCVSYVYCRGIYRVRHSAHCTYY